MIQKNNESMSFLYSRKLGNLLLLGNFLISIFYGSYTTHSPLQNTVMIFTIKSPKNTLPGKPRKPGKPGKPENPRLGEIKVSDFKKCFFWKKKRRFKKKS
jgi:hypothetical protein